MNERIGELLVKENLLTAKQLSDARAEAKGKGSRLGAEITQLGYMDENELTDFVAKQYGVPSINLRHFEIDKTEVTVAASGSPAPATSRARRCTSCSSSGRSRRSGWRRSAPPERSRSP